MYSIKNDYKNFDSYVIIPIKNFDLNKKYKFENISIYPAKETNIDELYSISLDYHFLEDKKDFMECSFIVYPIDMLMLRPIHSFNRKEMEKLISGYTEEADSLLNVFRFIFSNLDNNIYHSYIAGYIRNNTRSIMIYENLTPHYYSYKSFSKAITNEETLMVDVRKHKDLLNKYFSIFKEDSGEVGNILKWALKKYSEIVQESSVTNKFMFEINLIEFLTNPYEYESMKKLKKSFISFSANNKKEYDELSEWFRELTGKKVDGVEVGYRTNIIHNGKSLNQLIENPDDITLVIIKLQKLICNYIKECYKFYDKDWSYLKSVREQKKEDLQKKHTGSNTNDVCLNSAIVIDFSFFNKALEECYRMFPKYIDKKYNLEIFLMYCLQQVELYGKNQKVKCVILVKNKNEKIFNELNNLKIGEYNKVLLEYMNESISIDVVESKLKYKERLLIEFERFLEESNREITGKQTYESVTFISDDNKLDKEIYIKYENSPVELILGRLDNHRTKIDYNNVRFFDIQYLILDSVGIGFDNEDIEDANNINFIF